MIDFKKLTFTQLKKPQKTIWARPRRVLSRLYGRGTPRLHCRRRGRAIRCTPRSHSYSVCRAAARHGSTTFPFRFTAGCRRWLSTVEVIPRASAYAGWRTIPFKICFPIFLASLLFSCKPATQPQTTDTKTDSTLSISYAKGFAVDYYPRYKRITVFNPWKKNAVYARYYLVKTQQTTTPDDGQKITIPLHKTCATSCSQFEFLQLINEIESISGICSPQLAYNPILQQKYTQGKLHNLGDSFSPNIEQIQLLQPDALFLNGYNQDDPVGKRLSELGTTIIYDNEWTESSPLGRAEWIKFMAAFYDKELLADSIFSSIEKKYTEAKNKAKNLPQKPTVLSGSNFKGTWYMPAGRNYMAQLIADAGASYAYAADTNVGSLPLNFEVVLDKFRNADYWIAAPAYSLQELIKIDERHALFSAVKNKHVFNFNARCTPSGANDFLETGVARPDIILEDLIWIFHPELMTDYQPVFVKRLE